MRDLSLHPVPRLGVGILFNPSLPPFLETYLDAVDYVALIPDMAQHDQGEGVVPRFIENPSWTAFFDWLRIRKPLVGHFVGLSIGSASVFDQEYVHHMAQWSNRYDFAWYSEHLSFFRLKGVNAHDFHTGFAMAVPYDYEVLTLLTQRIGYIQQIVPQPFLLENNVYYFDIPDQDLTEPEFLTRLASETGCGLLLDLHNIYCNARNHGFNAYEFIDQVDLKHVIEIHIAGGTELDGIYTDSHAGPAPTEVWELLEYVVPRAPHLSGITFEFHDSYFEQMGTEKLLRELQQARAIWSHQRDILCR